MRRLVVVVEWSGGVVAVEWWWRGGVGVMGVVVCTPDHMLHVHTVLAAPGVPHLVHQPVRGQQLQVLIQVPGQGARGARVPGVLGVPGAYALIAGKIARFLP